MEPNFRFRSVDGNGHHSETEPHHRNWEMKIVQKVGQEVSSHREVEDEFAGVPVDNESVILLSLWITYHSAVKIP